MEIYGKKSNNEKMKESLRDTAFFTRVKNLEIEYVKTGDKSFFHSMYRLIDYWLIKEYEKDNLYCKNQLLNQSIEYEKKLSELHLHFQASINNLGHHYQVTCRNKDGSFKMECFN